MTYEPRPIATEGIALPEPLVRLTERLAENAHELWSRQRIKDGWSFGPSRDDGAKQHPCLVPYAELPESEKQYDRLTTMETLKAILALGYTIAPPLSQAGESVLIDPAERDALVRDLDAAGMRLGELLNIEQRLTTYRKMGVTLPGLDRELAHRLLRLGEPILAYDVTREALKLVPDDQKLRQQQALALSRVGDVEQAVKILEKLSAEPHEGPAMLEETQSILAGRYKEAGLKLRELEPARARDALRSAFDLYLEAFERDGGTYYPGINAATLALVLDQPDQARELAERVRRQCLAEIRAKQEQGKLADDYWLAATLGEAALILGHRAEAEKWYREASRIGQLQKRFGDMGSTCHQLESIVPPSLGLPLSTARGLFPMPGVAVFAGHMIDQPDRRIPRFPGDPSVEDQVRAAIRHWVGERDVRIGYASAACGSDLLFLEAILDVGGEAHVVLPYDRALFRADSVDIIPGATWGVRFDKVLERAKLHQAGQHRLEYGGMSYSYANLILHGLALTHAQQLGVPLHHLVVWDGQPAQEAGGTAHAYDLWTEQGSTVDIIDPVPFLPVELARVRSTVSRKDAKPLPIDVHGGRNIAIFFGDVSGFSKLSDSQLLPFEEHFLWLVARLLEGLPYRDQPLDRNTWGDGIFLVFPSVGAAGRYALDLREKVKTTIWKQHDLPEELSLRIGLHAGPTVQCIDSITKRLRFLGSHISHAARIEPIAPVNQVYASQAFAAATAASRVPDFECRYVGQMPLAKGHGIYPTYLLERRGRHKGPVGKGPA